MPPSGALLAHAISGVHFASEFGVFYCDILTSPPTIIPPPLYRGGRRWGDREAFRRRFSCRFSCRYWRRWIDYDRQLSPCSLTAPSYHGGRRSPRRVARCRGAAPRRHPAVTSQSSVVLPLLPGCRPAVVLRARDGGSHDKQSHGLAPILPVKATQMPRERLCALAWVITPPASQNARDGLFSGSRVARCIIPWYTPKHFKNAPCVEMPPGVRFYGTGV